MLSPKIALLVALCLHELLVRNLSPKSQNRRFNLPLLRTHDTPVVTRRSLCVAADAAVYLGVGYPNLKKWHSEGRGPKCAKIVGSAVGTTLLGAGTPRASCLSGRSALRPSPWRWPCSWESWGGKLPSLSLVDDGVGFGDDIPDIGFA